MIADHYDYYRRGGLTSGEVSSSGGRFSNNQRFSAQSVHAIRHKHLLPSTLKAYRVCAGTTTVGQSSGDQPAKPHKLAPVAAVAPEVLPLPSFLCLFVDFR
eukprot:EG_transcript_33359